MAASFLERMEKMELPHASTLSRSALPLDVALMVRRLSVQNVLADCYILLKNKLVKALNTLTCCQSLKT